jgi:outer membrane protein
MSTLFTRFTQAFIAWAAVTCFTPAVADDLTDVGYVDQAALSNIRAFREASVQVASYKEQLDKRLAETAAAAHGAAEQQRLVQAFSAKLEEKRRALLEPIFARAQTAIASVASSKNLSIVIDKRILITGGQDITQKVADLLTGISDPVPPVSTPTPSDVGFVDQARIEEVPVIKSTMDVFTTYRTSEQRRVESAVRTSKTTAGRQTLLREYQKRLADKQKSLIDPLLDRTRRAIADVARKKKLILVVDRGDVLYGGTDVTGDVVKGLGG